MTTSDHARREIHWKNYSESGLSTLLLYDTWHWRIALPILCNINSHQTNLGDDLVEVIDLIEGIRRNPPSPKPSGDPFTKTIHLKVRFPLGGFVNLALFSDGSSEPLPVKEGCSRADEFKLVSTLAKNRGISQNSQNENVGQELKTEVKTRTKANHDAFALLEQILPIFRSNPDHTEVQEYAPEYFIKWAEEKNIAIAWLDWAISNDLVKSAKADELGVTEKPLRVTPSDKRKQEGLQAAIEILNQKHANGELNDWQDFEWCTKKSEIIAFIRANPTDYPNCNKTKPQLNNDQAQTIKEREPTLTKSFLDFTKDPIILAEYERLTDKN